MLKKPKGGRGITKSAHNISDFLHRRSKCYSLLRKMTEDNYHLIKEKHKQQLSEIPSEYSLEIINLLEKGIRSKKLFKVETCICILMYLVRNSQSFVENNHRVRIKKFVTENLDDRKLQYIFQRTTNIPHAYFIFKSTNDLRKELALPPLEYNWKELDPNFY